ncbi:MAG: histidine--tRNA ligase [Chitinophagaceae bacterium]|nr:histidine--tRNA ligase [Chitinophagaceae bacterium]
MSTKPSIPQGTRDFSAEVVRKRNYIFSVIRNIFELYSFQPLETPAMENLETLMGKYGEEGDKLIFKILNNGINNEKNIEKSKAGFEKLLEGKSSSDITERALKYDLTIPFARYVAMNHTKLTFPFRRYQIQPVWRADRPQKGRYREFTQCDADVVGSLSLLNEVELANIYHEVFIKLGLKNYELKINSRKILVALAELCGGADKMIDITIAIDKLDKIGLEKVKEELQERGLKDEQITIIESYLNITGTNEEKLTQIKSLIGSSEIGKQGIEEVDFVFQQTKNTNLSIDFTLARGLNYYTGIIFEAKAPQEVKMGSIGGGGRYDDLTGLFGVPNIPGVGISFGVDRIYDVLEEMNLFPQDVQVSTKALLFNMGEVESRFAFGIMQQLRSSGIACELYHEATKINKQFTYAEKKNIPFVIIIGSKEIEEKNCAVKNLSTGNQETVALENLAGYLKNL